MSRLTAFSAVVLRQLSRDRTALFFMLALPVAIIVIIGTTFGGAGNITVGLVAPEDAIVTAQLKRALEGADRIEIRHYPDVPTLQRSVRRFTVMAGLVVPADADERLASEGGVTVSLLQLPADADTFTVRATLAGILDEAATPLSAATFAAERHDTPFDTTLARAEQLSAGMGNTGGGVAVETVDVTGPARDIGRFSRTAPQNLVLFTFITALTSSVVLIKARRNGVLRRALACRSGLGTQLAGLGLGWLSICLVQGLAIVGVGGLFFGVHWGDPLGAAGLLIVFSLVGCGAGLLVGALGSNEDRVSAITPIVGIVSGALGGCMVPLEVFPEGMRTVARFTPHFWALRGWERLVLERADAGDVAGSVAVLGAYAGALLVLSTVALRSALLRGS